jgi:hypothetical protein
MYSSGTMECHTPEVDPRINIGSVLNKEDDNIAGLQRTAMI